MKSKILGGLLAGTIAAGLAGCMSPEAKTGPVVRERPLDAFLERYSGVELEKGAKLALIVRGEKTSQTIDTFMKAELKDAGFSVKVLNPVDVLPASVSERITAKDKYSFTETAIKSIAIQAVRSDHAQLGLSEEAMKAFAWNNEVKEEGARVNDFSKYLDDFNSLVKKLDVDYVMTVQTGDPYSYYVEIISPRTSSLSGVYYLSASREAWNKRMPALKNGSGRMVSGVISVGESPRYLEMQYCNYLVGLLSGKKSPWTATEN